jgi:DNA-binding HxlR family transcriptional regulator
MSGRWKLPILRSLFEGARRFGQLQKELPGIAGKVLTQQLRELELDGIVRREVYPEIPPKVVYSLTPLGESLQPLVRQMHEWGRPREGMIEKGQESDADDRCTF